MRILLIHTANREKPLIFERNALWKIYRPKPTHCLKMKNMKENYRYWKTAQQKPNVRIICLVTCGDPIRMLFEIYCSKIRIPKKWTRMWLRQNGLDIELKGAWKVYRWKEQGNTERMERICGSLQIALKSYKPRKKNFKTTNTLFSIIDCYGQACFFSFTGKCIKSISHV